MANPAFSQSPAFSENARNAIAVPPVPKAPSASELDAQFAIPAATADEMGRMTYQDTIVKTVVSFAILVVGAAVGWVFPVLGIPACDRRIRARPRSHLPQEAVRPADSRLRRGRGRVRGRDQFHVHPGIRSASYRSAVFGTLGVVGVTLALFASGKIRASKRATQIFLVAMVGYLAFSLVNLVLMLTGVANSMFGVRDEPIPGTNIPLGVPLGILVVLLAAYSLVIDFEQVKIGVQRGAPRAFGWTAAFGIMLTVVWLYLEILRLLSYFMPRN